jgi:hypothetical protein
VHHEGWMVSGQELENLNEVQAFKHNEIQL